MICLTSFLLPFFHSPCIFSSGNSRGTGEQSLKSCLWVQQPKGQGASIVEGDSRASSGPALHNTSRVYSSPNHASHSFPNSRHAHQPVLLKHQPRKRCDFTAQMGVASHFSGLSLFFFFSFLLCLLSFLCPKIYCSNYSF